MGIIKSPQNENVQPQVIRTDPKAPLMQGKRLNRLASFFNRRQFCFELDSFMVVKMDVVINQRIGCSKILDFLAVDTLGFQDAKEIFSHSVVEAISTP